MGLGTWESYLANHIEGFFNKKFSSSLETVELMNGLEREVRHQASGKKRQDIDTAFIFSLNPGRRRPSRSSCRTVRQTV